nr:putative ribonuclease H-like domain-containing protein [Tanacetum cinerariifolium]
MLDYGFNLMNTKISIDNESTICIVKNRVFHSKTKHIEIRHHFIRDSYKKKLIQVIKFYTDHNIADLLTKAFDVSRFNFLNASIGLLNLKRGSQFRMMITKDGKYFMDIFVVKTSISSLNTTKKRTTKCKVTKISQSSGPNKLVANETVYKEWEDKMERATTTASSLEAEQDSGSGPRCQVTILGVQKLKLGLRLHLNSLIIYLSQEVLDLEEAKIAQAKEIPKLKKRVKKLENRRKSRPEGLKRLKKVGLSKQVESSEEKDSFGVQEDASKQGRIKFGVDDLEGNEVFVDVGEKIIEKEVSTADPATTGDDSRCLSSTEFIPSSSSSTKALQNDSDGFSKKATRL